MDTGIDDALALLYAVAHPELDLGAVTCVSGNVALRQVVRNTCFVLDLAQASAVPVGPGADATLLGQGPRLGHRHGANGLGDLPVQASGREPQPDTAVVLLSDRLRHAEQPVTLLALAPQANLAMSEAATMRLAQSDQPAVRFAGELLRARRGRLIGDAGALIMLTKSGTLRRPAGARPDRAARCRTRPDLHRSGRAEYPRRDRCGCGSGRAAICRCNP